MSRRQHPRLAILEAEGLQRYLENIMAFFVRHFEMVITYICNPGVPRTNNGSERANRRYRAVSPTLWLEFPHRPDGLPHRPTGLRLKLT